MLNVTTTPEQKRAAFRAALDSGELQRLPGAFNPLVAKALERRGVEGIYVSGAVMSAELALPDIGMTTLTEVAQRGHQIARVTNLPTLIDADTGFGEPMSAYRTVRELESAGLAGCHLEDQVNPKRCGHLDHKAVVDTEVMVRRIAAAVRGKLDPNFVVVARTDAKAIEGLDAAIERARAYADAGADAIFPEALHTREEFAAFRAALDVPLLANLTEFGKTPLLTTDELRELGFNMVIYPVTSLRLAMGAVERAFDRILAEGTQAGVVDRMQTRQELYDLLQYADYNTFDKSLFNFSM